MMPSKLTMPFQELSSGMLFDGDNTSVMNDEPGRITQRLYGPVT